MSNHNSGVPSQEKTDPFPGPLFAAGQGPVDEVGLRRRRYPIVTSLIARSIARGAARAAAGAAATAAAGTVLDTMAKRPRSASKADARTPASRSYVKRLLRNVQEKKCFQVASGIGNSGLPTSSGRVDALQTYSIVQGTGDNQRVGNQIELDKVTMRFVSYLPDSSPKTAGAFRLVIARDRQYNGATCSVTDILEIATPFSGYNQHNVNRCGGKRFEILADKFWNINTQVVNTSNANMECRKNLKVVLKKPGKINYDATAGAQGDVVTGEIVVLTIIDVTGSVIQGTWQMEYHDT